MHELGPEFAARAAHYDGDDLFVADNYADLKKHGVLPAGIPAELGGGGAEHSELAEMLRVLALYCGSTALALSMHTHQVATALWRWRRNSPPLERLLRSVAATCQQRWLGLDCRVRQGGTGRGWMAHYRTQDFCEWGSNR
jgi:alkylation response protein AidB-like acyl-CoA dehydrogenase